MGPHLCRERRDGTILPLPVQQDVSDERPSSGQEVMLKIPTPQRPARGIDGIGRGNGRGFSLCFCDAASLSTEYKYDSGIYLARGIFTLVRMHNSLTQLSIGMSFYPWPKHNHEPPKLVHCWYSNAEIKKTSFCMTAECDLTTDLFA